MSTQTITEFLEARIAEDEAIARAASHQKIAGPFHGNWRKDSLHLSGMERADAEHIARHDPSRVLAECAAKRAIVGLAARAGSLDDFQASQDVGFDDIQDDILRTLAAVYADHADYRQEWAL